MNSSHIPPLRRHLETWEREVYTQWQSIIRSPHTLRRIGDQLNKTLATQQRLKTAMQKAAPEDTPSHDDITRMLYLLERVEHQLNALAWRIERIESKLDR